jgi:nitrate reductase NapE component
LPLTGSRWDIRWLIGRRTKPTFCVFPVFSVAVMEKCCDACGDEGILFPVGFFGVGGCRCLEASIAVDRKSMRHRWLIGRRTKPTFCVFPVFSVAVMEKCCDACGDGNTIPVGFSASEGDSV